MRRGQHIGVALLLLVAIPPGGFPSVIGCKKDDQPSPSPSASASPIPIASAPPLPDEVYDDEPNAEPAASGSASADGSAARPRRHAPLASKRRPDPTSAARLFDDYGFPALAAVEHLCGRRDYPPGGGQLTWDAFAADTPPAELVDRYEKRLGETGFQRRGEGAIWTVPEGAPLPRTLEVLSLDAHGRHRACAAKPGPGAKSVIVISRR